MALITGCCSCCGRPIIFEAEAALQTCIACGTLNECPKAKGTTLEVLKRATEQRLRCDFHNAENSYQHVLLDYPDEHEALWGLALCRYGVEYVDDPATGKRLPVVHGIRKKPMQMDVDFEQACEHAPEAVRAQYEAEAEYIDNAMSKICTLAETCPPFDVFICHKTTKPGTAEYTEDYNRAFKLYHMLDKQGYRAFFAPMEMEGVAAGADYEAGIYHALETAKVMLVVCSDAEYLTSPWVRNEWRRFFEMTDNGADKCLLPLMYGELTPSKLPRDFRVRKVQTVVMGEMGSAEKVIATVKKYAGMPQQATVQTIPIQPAPVQTVPAQPAPTQTVPVQTAPTQTVPVQPGLAQTAPVQAAPVQTVPVQTVPAQTVPVQPVPAQTVPVQTVPAQTVPVQPVPAQTVPAQPAPTLTVQVQPKPTPVQPAPVRPAPEPPAAEPPKPKPAPAESPDPELLVQRAALIRTLKAVQLDRQRTLLQALTAAQQQKQQAPTATQQQTTQHAPAQAPAAAPAPAAPSQAVKYAAESDFSTKPCSNGCIITGYCGDQAHLVIPPSIDGRPVVQIGVEAFRNNNVLVSVDLPASVSVISLSAFRACTKLRHISLPERLTMIQNNAFQSCRSLESITLPKGITDIESFTFNGCHSLRKITLPSNVVRIGESAFDHCVNLKTVVLPNGLRKIDDMAFYRCFALERINVSATVELGKDVFGQCRNLPDSLKRRSRGSWVGLLDKILPF